MTRKFTVNYIILLINKKYYLPLFFIFFLILIILNGHLFNWVNSTSFSFTNKTENGLRDFTSNEKFVIIVLIGPLVETIVFQYLPIKILEKLRFKNNLIKIVIPSFFFALLHFYNPIYVVMTFISSLLLNKFYLESRTKSNFYLVLTALLHSLYNLYGYLFVK